MFKDYRLRANHWGGQSFEFYSLVVVSLLLPDLSVLTLATPWPSQRCLWPY
ncbi:hypothetical protein [Yersinia pestis]|uniref:Uncharacterized protein n=4 Tax=Yersinia pestis TaxID=632 RepID=Q8CL59_YERPE|nr:hypothetical protein [Yersinia pestis]AAM85653.1 hypothetical [Yersinia pestis KIM10+]ABG13573.1 conserved hypothetical protein [Yersinia pestis Antiqua]ABG18045.1 conserved hypothetical protein [Yersinia pestis Nepal516]ABP39287.1 conserved hypothetical protein [Yersinia pestis Pestoides F]EDR52323.1 conserved hypothetical protein [Yersinia pestis biovar Antiqua str. B42003004]EDR65921.1 conserved hypothetical protein [Yersinia pestis biovar Mediaevalis str. K1973002]EEO84062.1 hypotheti